MTVDEIFRDISKHQLTGVMFHDQMTDYFDFLNLHGYKKMQEYHAQEEMKGFRKIHTYFLNHFNKLVRDSSFENPKAIPEGWYEHKRQDVDVNTKRNAVKDAFNKWAKWESDTKKFYSEMYKALCDLNEIAAAQKVLCLVEDVDDELKWVERKQIELKSTDYAVDFIIDEQTYYFEFYKQKMCD